MGSRKPSRPLPKLDDDDRAWLRLYVAELVRIWTALSLIRMHDGGELLQVFKDLCSDKLRIMLYELAGRRARTCGFNPAGNAKYARRFAVLKQANNWFAGRKKNGLHYRDACGAHLQPLDVTEHMFQQFGYKGEREWRHLTRGVAACLQMMKLEDGKPRQGFWREVRNQVRGAITDSPVVMSNGEVASGVMPVRVKALLEGFRR
jgi:hypothetical protein